MEQESRFLDLLETPGLFSLFYFLQQKNANAHACVCVCVCVCVCARACPLNETFEPADQFSIIFFMNTMPCLMLHNM